MTTYTTITNAEIDQDSPITQPLLTALRDNPVAITEGAAGAPKVQAAALDTFIGRVNKNVGGDDSLVIRNLDTQASIICVGGVSEGRLDVQLSDSNGSAWATASIILNTPTTSSLAATLNISINLLNGDLIVSGSGVEDIVGSGITYNLYGLSGTVATPTGTVNAVRFLGTANFSLNVYGG